MGVGGATVTQVAQRHEVTRPQIYAWRHEPKRKGLCTPTPARCSFRTPSRSRWNCRPRTPHRLPGRALSGHGSHASVPGQHRRGGADAPDPSGGGSMIGPGTGMRVHVACGATDMRTGIAGLAALAQDVLRQKPAGDAVVAFRRRKGDRLKLSGTRAARPSGRHRAMMDRVANRSLRTCRAVSPDHRGSEAAGSAPARSRSPG